MEESPSRIHSHRPGVVAAAFGALLAVTAAAIAGAGLHLNQPPPGSAAPGLARPFAIESGESFGSVAQRLQREGIIRSPLVFRVLAGLRGRDTAIQAGRFHLPAGATARQVLDLLVDASQHLSRVTIPEGWTISRIAAYLERLGVAGAEEFMAAARAPPLMDELGIAGDTAEGYLFPDTYYFPPEYGAEAVVRHMVSNFFARLHEIDPGGGMDAAQLHATVTLASIVEREYRLPSEAPIIASVFYNRLRGNARLESCATIQYIITEVQGKEHPERILHADLDLDSAYNTYRRKGLPPGPIANPGLTALQAALDPARTDYWYFVVRDPAIGAHQFSTDLSAHSEAKFLYLKGVAAAPERARS